MKKGVKQTKKEWKGARKPGKETGGSNQQEIELKEKERIIGSRVRRCDLKM